MIADLDFVQQDHHLSSAIVRRKIEEREVIVAEINGSLVGSVRLEYL